MKIIILALAFLTIAGCTNEATNPLEKSAIARAESEPASADEYFLKKIEAGAAVEEQAIYLFGMGIAQEKLGNRMEAVNNYLAAEGLGNKSAAAALNRLNVRRD